MKNTNNTAILTEAENLIAEWAAKKFSCLPRLEALRRAESSQSIEDSRHWIAVAQEVGGLYSPL